MAKFIAKREPQRNVGSANQSVQQKTQQTSQNTGARNTTVQQQAQQQSQPSTGKHQSPRQTTNTQQRQTSNKETQSKTYLNKQTQPKQVQQPVRRATDTIKATVQNAPTVQQQASQQTGETKKQTTQQRTPQQQVQQKAQSAYQSIVTALNAKDAVRNAPVTQQNAIDRGGQKVKQIAQYTVKGSDSKTNKSDEQKSFLRRVKEGINDIFSNAPKTQRTTGYQRTLGGRNIGDVVGDYVTQQRDNRALQFGMSDAEQEAIARARGASEEDIALAKQTYLANVDYINRNGQHGITFDKMVQNQMRTAGGLPMDSWLRFLPDDDGNIIDRTMNSARAGILQHGQGFTGLQADIGNRLGANEYEQNRLKDYQYQQLLNQQALSGDNQGMYDRIVSNAVANTLTGLETMALGELGGLDVGTKALENLGLGNMGVNAFGNAYGQVRTGGKGDQYTNDVDAARRYAYGSALNELAQEKMFDALGLVSGGKITENTIPGANVFGLGSFMTEAAEEGAGALADPLTEALLDGAFLSEDYNRRVGEIYAEQGLLGTLQNAGNAALEGGLGGVAGGVMSNPYQAVRQVGTDISALTADLGKEGIKNTLKAYDQAMQNGQEAGEFAPNPNGYSLEGARAQKLNKGDATLSEGTNATDDFVFEMYRNEDGTFDVYDTKTGASNTYKTAPTIAQAEQDMRQATTDEKTSLDYEEYGEALDELKNNKNIEKNISTLKSLVSKGGLRSSIPSVRERAQRANEAILRYDVKTLGVQDAEFRNGVAIYKPISEKTIKEIVDISNRVGIPVDFLPYQIVERKGAGAWFAPGPGGKYSLNTGVIHLPNRPISEDTLIEALIHEITHTTEGSHSYEKFKENLRENANTFVDEDGNVTSNPVNSDAYAEDKRHMFGVETVANRSGDFGNKNPGTVESYASGRNKWTQSLLNPFDANGEVTNLQTRATKARTTGLGLEAQRAGRYVKNTDQLEYDADYVLHLKNALDEKVAKWKERFVKKNDRQPTRDEIDRYKSRARVEEFSGAEIEGFVNSSKYGLPVNRIIPYNGEREWDTPKVKNAKTENGFTTEFKDYASGNIHKRGETDLSNSNRSDRLPPLIPDWDDVEGLKLQKLNYSYKQDLAKTGLKESDIGSLSDEFAAMTNYEDNADLTPELYEELQKKLPAFEGKDFDTVKKMLYSFDDRFEDYSEAEKNFTNIYQTENEKLAPTFDKLGLPPKCSNDLAEELVRRGSFTKTNTDRAVTSLTKKGMSEEDALRKLDDAKREFLREHPEYAKPNALSTTTLENASDAELFDADTYIYPENVQERVKTPSYGYGFTDSRIGRLMELSPEELINTSLPEMIREIHVNQHKASQEDAEKIAEVLAKKGEFNEKTAKDLSKKIDFEITGEIGDGLRSGEPAWKVFNYYADVIKTINQMKSEAIDNERTELKKKTILRETDKRIKENMDWAIETSHRPSENDDQEYDDFSKFLEFINDIGYSYANDGTYGDSELNRLIGAWNENHPEYEIEYGDDGDENGVQRGFYIDDETYTFADYEENKRFEEEQKKREAEEAKKAQEKPAQKTEQDVFNNVVMGEEQKQEPKKTEQKTEEKNVEEPKVEEVKEETPVEENKGEEKKEETPKEETPEVQFPLAEPSPTELAQSIKENTSDSNFASVIDEIENPHQDRIGHEDKLNSVLAIAYYRVGASVEHANALAERKMSTGNSRTQYAPVLQDILDQHPGMDRNEARRVLATIHSRYNDMAKTAQSQKNRNKFTRDNAQATSQSNETMDAEATVKEETTATPEKSIEQAGLEQAQLEQAKPEEPQKAKAEEATQIKNEEVKAEPVKTEEVKEEKAEPVKTEKAKKEAKKSIVDEVAQLRAENVDPTDKIAEYFKSEGVDESTSKALAAFMVSGIKIGYSTENEIQSLAKAATQIAKSQNISVDEAKDSLIEAKNESYKKAQKIHDEMRAKAKTDSASEMAKAVKGKDFTEEQKKAFTDVNVKAEEITREKAQKTAEKAKKASEKAKAEEAKAQESATAKESASTGEQTREDIRDEAQKRRDNATEFSERAQFKKLKKKSMNESLYERFQEQLKDKPVIHNRDVEQSALERLEKGGVQAAVEYARAVNLTNNPTMLEEEAVYLLKAGEQMNELSNEVTKEIERYEKALKDNDYEVSDVGVVGFKKDGKHVDSFTTANGDVFDAKTFEFLKDVQKDRADSVADMAEAVFNGSSEAGRLLQAMSMLYQTPIGRKTYIERVLRKLNKMYENDLYERTGLFGLKKGKPIKLTLDEKLAQKYINAETNEARDEAMKEIEYHIADQIPRNASDALRQWRMTCMLANPKTHMRNIISNLATYGLFRVNDTTQAGIEWMFEHSKLLQKAIKQEYKTSDKRAVAGLVGKDYIEFARWLDKQDGYSKEKTGDGKFDLFEGKLAAGAFSNKTAIGRLLNKIAKGNYNALEGEDTFFVGQRAHTALAQMLQSQGYTITKTEDGYDVTKGTGKDAKPIDSKVLDAMKREALKSAQQATYHDLNKAAEWINNTKKSMGKAGVLLDVVVPFAKTPANIVARSIDFSPLGLLRSVSLIPGSDLYKVRNGEMSASTYVTRLSRGVTGTVAFILGALIANLGGISKPEDDDEDGKTSYYQSNVFGRQNLALHIGDKYYSLDWAMPTSAPFMMGAAMADTFKEHGLNIFDYDKAELFRDSIETLNPIIEASYMSSLNDLLTSYSQGTSYGGEIFGAGTFGGVERALTSIGENFVGQLTPSIGGAISRTVDPVKRTTSGNTMVERMQNKAKANLPFIRDIPGIKQLLGGDLEPAIDQKGQELTNFDYGLGKYGLGGLGRALYNFATPPTISQDTHDELDSALMDVGAVALPRNQTGTGGLKGQIMSDLNKAHMDIGDLSDNEYTEVKKTYYGNYRQYAKDYNELAEYNRLGTHTRDAVYKKIEQLALNEAKATYYDKVGDVNDLYTEEQKAALSLKKYGVSPAQFFLMKDCGLSGNRKALYVMSELERLGVADEVVDDILHQKYFPSAVGLTDSIVVKTPDEREAAREKYLVDDDYETLESKVAAYRAMSKEEYEAKKDKDAEESREDSWEDFFKKFDKKYGTNYSAAFANKDGKGGNSSKGSGKKGKSGGSKRSSKGSKSTKEKAQKQYTPRTYSRRGRSGGGGGGGSSTPDDQALFDMFMKMASSGLSGRSKSTIKASVDMSSDAKLWDTIMNGSKKDVEKLRKELKL